MSLYGPRLIRLVAFILGAAHLPGYAQTADTALPPPVPLSPIDSSTEPLASGEYAFIWTSVPGAVGYQFENAPPDSRSVRITDTVARRGVNWDALFTWRVGAISAGGAVSWSTWKEFSGRRDPNAPRIRLVSGQKEVPVLFQEPAAGNLYWISCNSGPYVPTAYFPPGQSWSSFRFPPGSECWMRSRDYQPGRSNTGFSNLVSFRTAEAPTTAPVPMEPQAGSTSVPLFPTFKWQRQRGARRYQVQLTEDSSFANLLTQAIDSFPEQHGYPRVDYLFPERPPDITRQLRELEPGKTYYWRVKSLYWDGVSSLLEETPWSAKHAFVTEDRANPPSLIMPFDGEACLPARQSLAWDSKAGDGLLHNVQVSASSSFDTLAVDTLVSSMRVEIRSLLAGGSYYWRVRTRKASFPQWSGFSAVWGFRILSREEARPLEEMVPIVTGMQWSYRRQFRESRRSFIEATGKDEYRASADTGEIRLEVTATMVRGDSLIFRVAYTDQGFRDTVFDPSFYEAPEGLPIRSPYSRAGEMLLGSWDRRVHIALDGAWRPYDPPYFDIVAPWEGTAEQFLRNGEVRTRVQVSECSKRWESRALEFGGPCQAEMGMRTGLYFLEGVGFIQGSRTLSTVGRLGTRIVSDSMFLSSFQGEPFNPDLPPVSILTRRNDPAIPLPGGFRRLEAYLRGLPGPVEATLFGPDGRRIVQCSDGRRIGKLAVPEGVYFLRVRAGGESRVFKLLK